MTESGTLPRGGSTSLLVPVPAGVEALQLTLEGIADGSQVRIMPIDPDGMPADSNASNHCYTDYADPASCNATARAVYRPKPGIWEFVIEARRTSGTDANTFTAAVSLQGMSVEPGSTTLDSVTMNEPTDVSMSGTNTFGPVDAHVTTGEIGTVVNLFSTVAQGELTANQLYVPRESTRLDVTLTPREAADLDFYVYFGGSAIGQGTATGDIARAHRHRRSAAGHVLHRGRRSQRPRRGRHVRLSPGDVLQGAGHRRRRSPTRRTSCPRASPCRSTAR